MAEPENEILKKQLKENITDSGIEELIITKQKLEEKEDKIEELNKKMNEYEELLKRKMADFENYKKRMKNELENKESYANQKLVEDILPIVDNFEKAIESAESNSDFDALFDGIKLIEKQFKQVLNKYNVDPIESIGQEFDPNLHDALMIEETGDYDVDTVIKEWQKGYMMGEKVLRHAQVVVGKANSGSTVNTVNSANTDVQEEPVEDKNKDNGKNPKKDGEISDEYTPPAGDAPDSESDDNEE